MSSFARKIRRRRLKEIRKDAQLKMRHVEESIANMPNECSLCSKEFDNEELDTWTIKMSMDGVQLICPECKENTVEGEN